MLIDLILTECIDDWNALSAQFGLISIFNFVIVGICRGNARSANEIAENFPVVAAVLQDFFVSQRVDERQPF